MEYRTGMYALRITVWRCQRSVMRCTYYGSRSNVQIYLQSKSGCDRDALSTEEVSTLQQLFLKPVFGTNIGHRIADWNKRVFCMKRICLGRW